MASNAEKIRSMYQGGGEDTRANRSRSTFEEFYYTEKIVSDYISMDSHVIEIGCATGYYGMRFADHCASYTGIDLTAEHIDIFREKIKSANLTNMTAQVGDATDLSGISDGAYDVVLCLGPMYHLPPDERAKVFAECSRIAKKGAVLAFAYISGLGVYAGACCHDEMRKFYPTRLANDFCLKQGRDDLRPDIFFFTAPEEMEKAAADAGLTKIRNSGLDFLFAASAIDLMTDEQFTAYRELADKMCESESCTGLANHALLVCRK